MTKEGNVGLLQHTLVTTTTTPTPAPHHPAPQSAVQFLCQTDTVKSPLTIALVRLTQIYSCRQNKRGQPFRVVLSYNCATQIICSLSLGTLRCSWCHAFAAAGSAWPRRCSCPRYDCAATTSCSVHLSPAAGRRGG